MLTQSRSARTILTAMMCTQLLITQTLPSGCVSSTSSGLILRVAFRWTVLVNVVEHVLGDGDKPVQHELDLLVKLVELVNGLLAHSRHLGCNLGCCIRGIVAHHVVKRYRAV